MRRSRRLKKQAEYEKEKKGGKYLRHFRNGTVCLKLTQVPALKSNPQPPTMIIFSHSHVLGHGKRQEIVVNPAAIHVACFEARSIISTDKSREDPWLTQQEREISYQSLGECFLQALGRILGELYAPSLVDISYWIVFQWKKKTLFLIVETVCIIVLEFPFFFPRNRELLWLSKNNWIQAGRAIPSER